MQFILAGISERGEICWAWLERKTLDEPKLLRTHVHGWISVPHGVRCGDPAIRTYKLVLIDPPASPNWFHPG